jgi:hypothetical protein
MSEGDRNERREVQGRLVRQGQAENDFDARFWREAGSQARFEALWDMVLEARAWRGEEGPEPRLQRSVLHIRRL